jgi:fatty-acid desaturase
MKGTGNIKWRLEKNISMNRYHHLFTDKDPDPVTAANVFSNFFLTLTES